MITCENIKEAQYAGYSFNEEEAKVIKSSISQMRSSINRLEQNFTKQDSFNGPLSFTDLVNLHNQLGLFFTNTCVLLELVSGAESELSNYLNKYL